MKSNLKGVKEEMDRNYLLTFSYLNDAGKTSLSYAFYESEEEMIDDIRDNPQWEDLDAVEINVIREIPINL